MIYTLVYILFAVTCTHGAEKIFEINKCCPNGQKLDLELNCVDLEPDDVDDEVPNWRKELLWFPIETVVDSNTLKIHEHERQKYLDVIKTKYRVNYGVMPECEDSNTRQFAYHRERLIEFYNFIMNNDGSMRVHVSKPSSLHDADSETLHFPKIKAQEEATLTSQANDSFRTIPLEDTCVDFADPSIHTLIFCPCRTLLCTRKCCPQDYHFSVEDFECVKNSHLPDEIHNWRPRMDSFVSNYYLLSSTYPSCDNLILLKHKYEVYSSCTRFQEAWNNEFTIYTNGSLKVRKYKKLFDTSEYCGEVTVSQDGSIEEQNLILCSGSEKYEKEYNPIVHTFYGVLLIIGGTCLLLTCLISLYLPSLRRKVHNKIALCHNASLMVSNYTWAVTQLWSGAGSKACIVLGFMEQFTMMASFFWLNAMCIDISMTFSCRILICHKEFTGPKYGLTRYLIPNFFICGNLLNSNKHLKSGIFDGGTKTFIYYSIYAWGCTSLISIVTIIIEFSPDPSLDYYKPGFACQCGFNTDNWSILVHLYGPMAVLLLINLFLSIYTTIRIMNIQKQTAMLHKTDSNTTGSSYRTDKQRYDLCQWLLLYGKLFLLMGITWIMEIISWAVGGPTYYWYFSDALNLIRGVIIFILFVCKKQVIRNLKNKWRGDPQSFSEKTASGRSHTDEIAFSSNPTHDGRVRSSVSSGKRKESNKSELDFSKTLTSRGYVNSALMKESAM